MTDVNEYVQAVQDLADRRNRGELNHRQMKDKMRDLRDKYREAGVPVDSVGFGSKGSTARNPEGTFEDIN